MCAHVHVFQNLARWLLLPIPCGTDCWVHRFIWNKHTCAHKNTHIVFCVALAGGNTSISIWKTAAGRCSCHCCCCLLLVVLSIWMAAPLFSLTLALLTFAVALPPVFLCVSFCLSVMLLFSPPETPYMTNHIPQGVWGTYSTCMYEEWTVRQLW